MHGESEVVSHVIFGMDPFWVSCILFIVTYVVIITEKINRAIVAGIGAGLMISVGVLNQQQAIAGVDFNTLGLLTGMMVIVAITRRCGVFQFVAIWSAKKVDAKPWGILLMLSLVTAVFSAILDNVTTVLLIAPVTLLITEELKVNPYPYLFAEIFASNIGGTATLIGDPPNIMIGSAVGLSFNDFLYNLAPITPLIMLVTLIIIYFIWGKGLEATDDARQRIMNFREREAITDVLLLKQSMAVLSLVVIGFIFAHPLKLEPATIAMLGAGLLLLLSNLGRDAEQQTDDVHHTFGEVEWVTIFFFVGLFIVVSGIEHAGLLKMLADWVVGMTGGDITVTAIAIIWVSAIASALVDNIPFVATMIPMIESMAPTFGGTENLMPLWWSLALGACLGGNGSLIGASANLIVAGFAERAGHRIQFLPFMAMAFPLMLVSICIATLYVYLRYL
ncbi:MAG: ArsB/NhaD family transporter [Gammaproteobacteria bacterium]|jgi:Na+/H+ antiporter NhaD/arsenite permease-like protein|nr:ArsB/NhaD family transporter [Gammaproteobacteria bacterium]MBT4078336.1 ArsB/NhaD family transporter [Gammaproteobacteria bacterium]MBT4196103.1 ArsB/NhaD family transporter [Gammaproteobacteria bacterium]MBT4451781.1 ArsB/NhaD family transporter [Gammaproteobacteria bacterium]MBT4862209.1 ArsB/NhaD family transporter [Gammaproteobacteria bacterium]